MLKIAVIGAGYWGKNIVRNFYELGVLHTVCDSKTELLDVIRKNYTNIEITSSFEALFKNPEIRAIAIATPAVSHYNIAKEALKAGKDVFVEKPLSLTVKEGEELVYLAKQKNRILMVGHLLHYHQAIKKLKELISTGELGKVQYIYSNRLNIGKLRTEENILWSFAPHDISVILMLLEEEPVSVAAFGGDYLNKGIYDTTMTTLEFRNGVKGHIFVSWLHPFKEQKLVVVGSKAMAVFDDVSKEKLFLYPHKIEWKEGKIPVAKKADYQIINIGSGEPLKEELSHFIECVMDRKRPRTDGAEGLRVLKILEAAEKGLLKSKHDNGKKSSPEYSVHESAYVDKDVEIGEGTSIWHFSHVLKGSTIGKNCKIGQNVVIGPNAVIGKNVKIQNNISVYEGVTLEDNVFCGPSMVFTNVFNPRSEIPRMKELKETLVKQGATIGANATIVCGNTIGRYAFIGAGAVVTKDVPDYGLVMGNPAKLSGWICRCGVKLKSAGKKNKIGCETCGNTYRLNRGKLEVVEEGQ
ncbi:MAG: Gfo/Idh/MocA family oxidoreductase [Nitrospirae bacterium]|nr:Gfo/Idh/MocA family oxidoreductase [Nitrospirota bacterium]